MKVLGSFVCTHVRRRKVSDNKKEKQFHEGEFGEKTSRRIFGPSRMIAPELSIVIQCVVRRHEKFLPT